MPQMSPINWLSLFFTFCLTFLMFNLMNYFSFIVKNYYNNNNNDNNNNNINHKNNFMWKW